MPLWFGWPDFWFWLLIAGAVGFFAGFLIGTEAAVSFFRRGK